MGGRKTVRLLLVPPMMVATALAGTALGATRRSAPSPARSAVDAATKQQLEQAYGKLPLSFEANQGQTDAQVNFLARTAGQSLFLTPDRAVLSLKGDQAAGKSDSALGMRLLGANSGARPAAEQPLPGKVNYLTGTDPASHRTNVPTFGRVGYSGVYPGIDVAYYGNQRQFEYDFTVAPGADPKAIALAFEGADGLRITDGGDLVVSTPSGDLTHAKPVIYQEIGGQRRPVDGRFSVNGDKVGFVVGSYDKSRPLVIDPTLAYSTYLGGSGQELPSAMAVDGQGNAYVVGTTRSPDFPTTAGALKPNFTGSIDVFVTKLSKDGRFLEYSTFIGGSGSDFGVPGIAVDGQGSAYVTGRALSADFPTTPGAFQSRPPIRGSAFLSKLNAQGSALLYSTYFGAPTGQVIVKPALDGAGDVYLYGTASFTNPSFSTALTTSGALKTSCTLDAFAPPGSPPSCSDGILAKLHLGGNGAADLVYGAYLGGSGADEIASAVVDGGGVVYVAGATTSSDFPITPNAFRTTAPSALSTNASKPVDAFVAKINPAGGGTGDLVYATYLGGSQADAATDVALGPEGTVYITGTTRSPDFPTTPGALQRSLLTKAANHSPDPLIQWPDAFMIKLVPAGGGPQDLLYSTYLGSTGRSTKANAIAVDSRGYAFLAGEADDSVPTASPLPCCPTSRGGDAFVTEINPGGLGQADLIFSTHLGGTASDAAVDLALGVDRGGRATAVYVAGYTGSTDFPVTPAAFQRENAGDRGGFVAKIDVADLLCTRTLTGFVQGPVVVKSGEELCLKEATVRGGITVERGGAANIQDSRVVGPIRAEGSTAFTLCGTTVAGEVRVTDPSGFVTVGGDGCAPNRITGRTTLPDVTVPPGSTTTTTRATTTTSVPASTTSTTTMRPTTTTTRVADSTCARAVQAQREAVNAAITRQQEGQTPAVVAALEQQRAHANAAFDRQLKSC